jgi:hypothetical protein
MFEQDCGCGVGCGNHRVVAGIQLSHLPLFLAGSLDKGQQWIHSKQGDQSFMARALYVHFFDAI